MAFQYSDARASTIIATDDIPTTYIRRSSRRYSEIKLGINKNSENSSSSANLLETLKAELSDENEKEVQDEFIIKKEPYSPEGPWGWLIVFAAFCTNFVVDGISLSYGIMTEVITESKQNETDAEGNPVESTGNITIAQFNTVGSILLAVTLMMGPFASVIAEKFGFRRTAILGSIIATLGVFLSWATSPNDPNFWSFMIGFAVIGGLGFGLLFTSSVVIVGLYFSKNRALATGITVAGTGVGILVMAPVIQTILEKWGWGGAMLFQTGLCAISVLFGVVYREIPLREVKVRKSEVKRAGMMPVKQQVRELLTSPSFLIVSISGSLVMMGYFAPFGFLKDSAKEHIDESDAVFLLTVLGIANAVGRVFFGMLANKIGHSLHISNVALTAGGLVTALYPFATTHAYLIICAVVFGMYSAVYASLRSIVIMKIVKEEKFNVAFGLSLMFMGVATLFSNTLGGYLKDATETYNMSFHVAGAFLIASAVICYPLPWILKWEEGREDNQPIIDIDDALKAKIHQQQHQQRNKSLDGVRIIPKIEIAEKS